MTDRTIVIEPKPAWKLCFFCDTYRNTYTCVNTKTSHCEPCHHEHCAPVPVPELSGQSNGQFEMSMEKHERMVPYFEDKVRSWIKPVVSITQLDKSSALKAYASANYLTKLHDGREVTIKAMFRVFGYYNYVLERKRDFTIEKENGTKTGKTSPSTYSNLSADWYFYAWANHDWSGFYAYFWMDISQYKFLISTWGVGIDKIAELIVNSRTGGSSFYAIPVYRVKSAIKNFFFPGLDQYKFLYPPVQKAKR